MRRRKDTVRRPRPVMLFDERVEAARKAVFPEEPIAYIFVPEEGRGFFRVKAITTTDLKIKNEEKP